MQAETLSAGSPGRPPPVTATDDALLGVRGLRCARNEMVVFRDLSFHLPPGQILLVEGENGSGKTSLLRILCGLLEPEAGEVLWRGRDIRADYDAYLREICYVGHGNGIKSGLTTLENLAFLRDLSAADPETDLEAILARFSLRRHADVPAQYLSAGQRRRLALSRLLLAPRPLWILDEPFTALDADGRDMLRGIFREQLDGGGAAVMTSHDPFTADGLDLQRLALS